MGEFSMKKYVLVNVFQVIAEILAKKLVATRLILRVAILLQKAYALSQLSMIIVRNYAKNNVILANV